MNSALLQIHPTEYTILKLDMQSVAGASVSGLWMIVCPGALAMLSSDGIKPKGFTSYAVCQKLVNTLNDAEGLAQVFKGGIPSPISVPMVLPFLTQPEQVAKVKDSEQSAPRHWPTPPTAKATTKATKAKKATK